MKSIITPGIVYANLACLFGVNLYMFFYGATSAMEYARLGEVVAGGLVFILAVAAIAAGSAVLSFSYKPARNGIKPYMMGFVISVPVLVVGWVPAFLIAWDMASA